MAEVAAVKSLVAHFSAQTEVLSACVFISPKSGRVGQSYLCSLVLVVGCKAQVGRWCGSAGARQLGASLSFIAPSGWALSPVSPKGLSSSLLTLTQLFSPKKTMSIQLAQYPDNEEVESRCSGLKKKENKTYHVNIWYLL